MNHYAQRIEELGGKIIGAPHGRRPIHVSEERLQEVEQQLNTALPPDYREFIQDYGHFYFSGATFPIRPNADHIEDGDVEFFHYIITAGENATGDLVACYHSICSSIPTWPSQWMPIAISGGANSVALCIRGEEKGAVAFYDNDYWTDDTPNLYLIADSFDEFMQLIHID